MRRETTPSGTGNLLHGAFTVAGAGLLTLGFFLVLPLMETISKAVDADLVVQDIATAEVPPPPPPPESEPDKPPEQPDQPPEMTETAPPLDLSQLELALNPGAGGDWMAGDFAVKLNTLAAGSNDAEALFALSDLDQRPRVVWQPGPVLDAQLRKKAPGTVHILFVVDQQGRVENPIVQSSTDPVFVGPALAAVKQWKFEPGKRNGQAVRFRMRVPITFPAG